MYNNYEEYMQNVLGYNNGAQNTYRESENYYYDTMRVNQNVQEMNSFYPEIYGIVYPMVQKVCSRRGQIPITEETLSQMVDEIYNVIESGDEELGERETNVKNGDVRNPKDKETRRPRPNNYLLRDLIRILILRELLSGGPIFGPGRPGMMPGPMPGRPGMGGMPPIMRPGASPRMF